MDGLLDAMPSALFSEWIAYWTLEPFALENRNAAMIACLIANTHRHPDTKPYEIMHFMPVASEEEKDSGSFIERILRAELEKARRMKRGNK